MTDTHIAKLMWDAYAIQAGWESFDGKPLPAWDELSKDRQSCWVAAASVTASRIKKLEAARDGAYAERNRLVAFLSNIYPSGVKKTAIPGWDEAWHNCVYIDLPVGQASWHYHNDETHLFAHLPPYENEWDGHTTEEKYERISLAANHAKQTDELLADYMKFADALMIQTNNQNKRIEKLEAALSNIIVLSDDYDKAVPTARKALEGKDD